MVYCRFSSSNFQSDIFLYSDFSEGYALHVAQNRVAGNVPELPDITLDHVGYWKAHKIQMAFIESAKQELIEHPDAGRSFYLKDLDSLLEKLEELKKAGFRVPASVLKTLTDPPATKAINTHINDGLIQSSNMKVEH